MEPKSGFRLKAANIQGMPSMYQNIKSGFIAVVLSLVCTIAVGQIADPEKIASPQSDQIGVPQLRAEARKAYEAKNHLAYRTAMENLHKLRPNNSEYMYQLVLANALLDDKSSAFDVMLKMQRQGLSYDFDKTDESLNLRKTQVYTYLNDLMVDAGNPIGLAVPVATLESDVLLPEGIEWDSSRNAILVSTVNSGSILAVSEDGTSSELFRADENNRIWGIYDIAIDVERNRLWAITTANKEFVGFHASDSGRSALVEFDLKTFEIIKRYPVPVDGLLHKLRNVVISSEGDVFAIDGVFPILYTKKASETRLKALSAYKNMVSLRGMDISADGKLLYLADYEMGVLVIELETMRTVNLQVPEELNLGGIAGLNYWNGKLIVIQNGIKPQRVMSLLLDASGTTVTEVAPLAVNLDVMDFPSYGTVVGDNLMFFANSHWAATEETAKPIHIVKTLLSSTPVVMAADAKKFMHDYATNKGTGKYRKVGFDSDEPAEAEASEEKKD
ncbi:MAG: hypothetical protein ACI9CB_001262 [Rhodothermales bacterium]